MEKEHLISEKEAVHKLQLSLLDGIRHENQLFAAGSVLSRSDYEDVVTERSISNVCGYPLCKKRLREQPKKGRYRVSLKEHKVYDLRETYMFCSSGCLINSRAFAGTLEEERCSLLNPAKIVEVLKLFEELSLDKDKGLGDNEDFGFSDLRIEEKLNIDAGEVSLEDWVGPSNAIEGYVPNMDFSAKASTIDRGKEGSESIKAKPKKRKDKVVGEMDFTNSSIIVGGQFGVPRFSYGPELKVDKERTIESKQNEFSIHEATSASMQNGSRSKLKESKLEVGGVAPDPEFRELGMFHCTVKSISDKGVEESKPEECAEKLALSIESMLTSSVKPSGGKHFTQSVSWADERKSDNMSNGNVQDMGNIPYSVKSSGNSSVGVSDGCSWLASEDDRELAPNQVEKVVPIGESDITKDERGTTISLQLDAQEGDSQKIEVVSELLVVPLQQTKKPSIPISESFDINDFRTLPAIEKQQPLPLKDAVHKLQISLLEGIHHENQLFVAQSLITRSEYDDVLTKRSLANVCGYPLCNNPLPTERLQKDQCRISLKQSKGPYPRETKMFCSTGCASNSRTFSGRLQVKRCLTYNCRKINEILKLFGELGSKQKENIGEENDLQEWKIDDKVSFKDASLEDCILFDSIGGCIPEVDCVFKPSPCGHGRGGAESSDGRLQKGKCKVVNEMDSSSTITAGDRYAVLKMQSASKQNGSEKRENQSEHDQFSNYEATLGPVHNVSEDKLKESMAGLSRQAEETQLGKQEIFHIPSQNGFEAIEESEMKLSIKKTAQSNASTLKSSLRPSGKAKKLSRSVTWADEKKANDMGSGYLCTFHKIGVIHDNVGSSTNSYVEGIDDSLRLASAEACALALSQAAYAVSSGEYEITDAVSDAGIIVLPQFLDYDGNDGESQEDAIVLASETDPLKLSDKPGVVNSKLFNGEDSWYDAPPEGFSLTLSSFATMWAALFGWITSSSLAYIYGRDASFHEEFILVNGKEYPRKTFLGDGRSSEIKLSLAGVLARIVPELVTELRLRVPLSALEHGMECLLDTMSFMDPLPSLGTEQWHVLALLFIDALSVCRIPGLAPYMTSMRMLLHKVLGSAPVTLEEYESMKDILIPLGRRPQFSAQSGG